MKISWFILIIFNPLSVPLTAFLGHLAKLCQADGADDGSLSLVFLICIIIRLSYFWHWKFHLMTTVSFSESIALFWVHGSTPYLMGDI